MQTLNFAAADRGAISTHAVPVQEPGSKLARKWSSRGKPRMANSICLLNGRGAIHQEQPTQRNGT